ncbi:MAG: hypothetical protein Kow0063_29070 [Anaerolineae bacterium]
MFQARRLFGPALAIVILAMLVPLASAQMTPGVTVGDQAIVNGVVTVEKVVSQGPGWIVIHAQAEGKPGPILGYTQVADGENSNVQIQIDATRATPVLYAMLHTDAGQVGVWEFPGGPDTPVTVDGQVVTPPFNVTAGVGVADQEIIDNQVNVARVYSQGPGWIVIHAQAEGKPGPILGYTQVADGESTDVVVEIDAQAATSTLYAMLHVDAGQVGIWEFPGGPDAPVKVGDAVITPPFNIISSAPPALPETGGTVTPWTNIILLVAGGLILAGGLGLAQARRIR